MSTVSMPNDSQIAHDLAASDFQLMEHWDDAQALAIISPTMHNAEAAVQPPAARQQHVVGPFHQDWLGPEDFIQPGDRDLGRGGDVGHRGRGIAPLDEQLGGALGHSQLAGLRGAGAAGVVVRAGFTLDGLLHWVESTST